MQCVILAGGRGTRMAAYTAKMPKALISVCGKPFVDHLVGTASIAADAGERLDVVIAALLHAAYNSGDFGDGTRVFVTAAKRRRVQRVIGVSAERLVAAYSRFPWSPVAVAALARRPVPFEGIERDVLVLRLANEIVELVQ